MLWKCGDSRLKHTLSRGGVTSVSLIDMHSSSTSRFPRCLSSFLKLRNLSIDRSSNRLMNPEEGAVLLQSLPSSLERLELTFDNVEECFYIYSASGDSSGTLVPSDKIWSVKKAFPSLRTLLLDDSRALRQNSSWTETDLNELPPSLTHIKLCPGLARYSPIFCAALPKGLLTLECSFVIEASLALLEALPPSIICPPPMKIREIQHLDQIPASATRLSLQNVPFENETLSCFSRFDNLVELCLSRTSYWFFENADPSQIEFSRDFLCSLPRTLTKLELPEFLGQDFATLQIEDLQHLPTGLVDLTLFSLAFSYEKEKLAAQTNDGKSLMPLEHIHALRRLVIQDVVSIKLLNRLPASITELTLNGSGESEPIEEHLFNPALPSSLKTLSWRQAFLNPHCSSNLPRHMTMIDLMSPKIWDAKSIAGLPRCLTSLRLRDSLVTEEACEHMPPTLSILQVSQFAKAGDENVRFGQEAYYFASAEAQDWDYYIEANPSENTSKSGSSDHSREESPDLIYMHSEYPEQEKVISRRVKRDVSLSSLPQSLTELKVTKSVHYSSALVPSLPPGLKNLQIPFLDSSHPREALHLPRGLLTLHMRPYGQLQASDIDDLPKTLTSFSFNGERNGIEGDLHDVLPPNLDMRRTSSGLSIIRDREAARFFGSPLVTPDPRVVARLLGPSSPK